MVPPVTRSGRAPGRSATSGFSASTSIMRSMSVSDCLISRYTMPMKLSGMNSCSISALTITKWPTVLLPAATSSPAITMTPVSAMVKITAWPVLSTASEV